MEKETLVAKKFLYPSIEGVSRAFGRLISVLFTWDEIQEVKAEEITPEIIKKIQAAATEKMMDLYSVMGEVLKEFLPAGLRLPPEDPAIMNMDAEDCIEYLYQILKVNSSFFTKLLRAPLDTAASLSIKQRKPT